MKYRGTDNVVRVGDRVLYAGTPGVVVFVIDDDSYSDGFPKEQWAFLGKGLGVKLQEGTLFHFASAEGEEDLEPVEAWNEVGKGHPAFPLARDHTGQLAEGTFIGLRADGSRLCEVSYQHGIMHGRYRDFWPNGRVACEGQFQEGKREGTWHYYNEDGSLRDVIYFKEGREREGDIHLFESG